MTVTLSPLLDEEAVELSKGSGKWRKQILPSGKFNYKGKELDFDEIGKNVKLAFDSKALDQVAFQFADSGNNHNFDPRNYGGELEALEYVPGKGTIGTFDFSKHPETAAFVAANPKFGVSARIEQNLERGDGKKFPYAFSHVLGTLNPRVTGMTPWEAVELSHTDPNEEVLDLVAATNEGDKGVTKPEENAVTLSKDVYDKLMKIVEAQEEVEQALNLSNDSGSGSNDDSESNEAIKLANERADQAMRLARQGQIELAATKWEKKDAELRNAGVPPKVLDLAKDVMSAPDTDVSAIELSNGSESKKVDPKAVLLSVLEEMKGTIDLAGPKGHEFGGDADGEDKPDPGFDKFRDQLFADQF